MKIPILAISVIAALAFAGFYWMVEPMRHGELVQKPVYASLQGAWNKHRDDRAAMVEERVAGKLLVGVLDEKGRRVWLSLSEVRHGGGVYSVPGEGEAGIGCGTIRRLAERYEMDLGVKRGLEDACVPSANAM
ncbi:hypothetical protein [Lysobacter enzymogenes]|uniref:Uncharacterized protein n=1 Tax=Lysobacter enzymogenes TaxID=69 RepID=A0A3N2RD45_LYSEN|nr:hypothetical protein [Lysobacter enzymogenes]ROU05400.1 hypothetical protein D9T17_18430 [Lysobacter enzymogenes]